MAQEPASRSNDVAEEHLASVLFLLGRQVESPSGKLKRPFSAAWQPRPAVLPAGMRRPISAAMLRQQQRASSPSLLLSYGSKTTSPRSANFMAGRDPMLPPQPRTRYRPTSAYVRSALRSAQDSEPPPRHQIGRVLSGGRPSSAPSVDVPASHLDPVLNGSTQMLLRPASMATLPRSNSGSRLLVAAQDSGIRPPSTNRPQTAGSLRPMSSQQQQQSAAAGGAASAAQVRPPQSRLRSAPAAAARGLASASAPVLQLAPTTTAAAAVEPVAAGPSAYAAAPAASDSTPSLPVSAASAIVAEGVAEGVAPAVAPDEPPSPADEQWDEWGELRREGTSSDVAPAVDDEGGDEEEETQQQQQQQQQQHEREREHEHEREHEEEEEEEEEEEGDVAADAEASQEQPAPSPQHDQEAPLPSDAGAPPESERADTAEPASRMDDGPPTPAGLHRSQLSTTTRPSTPAAMATVEGGAEAAAAGGTVATCADKLAPAAAPSSQAGDADGGGSGGGEGEGGGEGQIHIERGITLGNIASTPLGILSTKRLRKQDERGRLALEPKYMTIEPDVPINYLPRRHWPPSYHVLTDRHMVALDSNGTSEVIEHAEYASEVDNYNILARIPYLGLRIPLKCFRAWYELSKRSRSPNAPCVVDPRPPTDPRPPPHPSL